MHSSYKEIKIVSLDEVGNIKIDGFVNHPIFKKSRVSRSQINPLKHIYYHGIWRLNRGKNLSAQFRFDFNQEVHNDFRLKNNLCPEKSFMFAHACIEFGLNWKTLMSSAVGELKKMALGGNNDFETIYFHLSFINYIFAARIVFNGSAKKEKSFEEIKTFVEENKEILPSTIADDFIYKYEKENFIAFAGEQFVFYSHYLILGLKKLKENN